MEIGFKPASEHVLEIHPDVELLEGRSECRLNRDPTDDDVLPVARKEQGVQCCWIDSVSGSELLLPRATATSGRVEQDAIDVDREDHTRGFAGGSIHERHAITRTTRKQPPPGVSHQSRRNRKRCKQLLSCGTHRES